MVNGNIPDSVYDPGLDFSTDSLEGLQGVGDAGLTDAAASGKAADDTAHNAISAIGGALGGIGALGSIGDAINDLFKIIGGVIGPVEHGIADALQLHPNKYVEQIIPYLIHPDKMLNVQPGQFFSWLEDISIANLFMSYLTQGLGLNEGALKSDAGDAIHTVDTMLGFAVAMQFATAAIESIGKPLLANRWTSAFVSIFAKLPEELGLSWALGMSINRAFEAAQGVALEEAINKQKTPQRIAWPQLRLLLKQHVIDAPTFDTLMQNQGFPTEQRKYLAALQDVMLPIGDISQLWYRDIIGDDDALKRIKALGFTDEDADKLFTLYVKKSENEASVLYRSTARSMFVSHLITEDMYRGILADANYPHRMIEQDVAAINLEHSLGRVLQSVSAIKQEYQHGVFNDDQATTALTELNYAPAFIGELLETWKQTPIRAKHGLSQSKIMSYRISGLLTREEAHDRLVETGLLERDITFLLDHPTASGSTHLHELTPALVIQAYVDGAVLPSGLKDALARAKVSPEAMSDYVAVAQTRLSHKKGSPGADIPLTAGEWKDAFKYGIIDFQTLVQRYEHLGYNPDNALLLAEIANKGPETKPRPAAFANVEEAIAYMVAHGYKIIPPPDPMLGEAEAVLSQYGYSWEYIGGSVGIGSPFPPPVPRPQPGPGPGPGPNPTGG